LYGALDNDDFYMYTGGLASAIRNLGGDDPELVVTNTRNPANPEMTSIDEFIGTEFRSRYVNPTWIEGMQTEGYAGAGEMRAFVEYLWGWDATLTSIVDDAMWQESFAVYVQDKHGLDLKEFFDSEAPFAYQDLTARMIETVRKEYWQADTDTLTTLLTEYIDNVNRHGVGCAEHTCGNPQLLEYVIEQALEAGVPVPAVEAFSDAMEQAIGAPIEQLVAAAAEFIRQNEAGLNNRQVPGAESIEEQTIESTELQGYLMQTVEEIASSNEPVLDPPRLESKNLSMFLLALLVLGVLGVWRWRRAVA